MDLTHAFPTLARYRPISDLISVPVLTSVIVAATSCIVIQVGLV